MNKVKRIAAGECFSGLTRFINKQQLQAMSDGLLGEEGEYFADKLIEVSTKIDKMPKTYEQDGLGDDAIVHLHYFLGGHDWYITEKDMTPDEDQHQAFGYACLDWGYPEVGYISIQELIDNMVELDLFWTPVTLREVKAIKSTSMVGAS